MRRRERYRDEAPARGDHFSSARGCLCRVVGAFDQHVGQASDDQLARRIAVERDDEIDGLERSEDGHAVFERVERSIRSLAETTHRVVRVDGNDERSAEGTRLVPVLEARLADIAELVGAAEDSAARQPEMLKARLAQAVAELLEASPALPADRLAQEAAVLAIKADIREELDRLSAHIVAAQELLAEGGAIGRRFDFLCQEFNREANTLCAKSADVALTRTGLALKAAIEQLREQVQNLE